MSSFDEVEHVFASMANGDAFVPVPAGVTRSGDAAPHEALPDLPIGGIAFVGVLTVACFASLYVTALHPVLFAAGTVSLLVGTVAAGAGYREWRRRGPSAVVERLRLLDAAVEESGGEELPE